MDKKESYIDIQDGYDKFNDARKILLTALKT
jgi:hypothetical protein